MRPSGYTVLELVDPQEQMEDVTVCAKLYLAVQLLVTTFTCY